MAGYGLDVVICAPIMLFGLALLDRQRNGDFGNFILGGVIIRGPGGYMVGALAWDALAGVCCWCSCALAVPSDRGADQWQTSVKQLSLANHVKHTSTTSELFVGSFD